MMSLATTIIIGICGVSGSGKSDVTKALSAKLSNAPMIFWDDYESLSEYPSDYIDWYKHSKDYSAWKTPVLAGTLDKLKNNLTISCPATNNTLNPDPFLVYDAPLGRNHEETGKYIDFLVFLDVPSDITLIRRLRRDFINKKEFDLEAMKHELDTYEKEARPLFLDIETLKQGADLLVNGLQSLDLITDTIVNEVQKRYGVKSE